MGEPDIEYHSLWNRSANRKEMLLPSSTYEIRKRAVPFNTSQFLVHGETLEQVIAW